MAAAGRAATAGAGRQATGLPVWLPGRGGHVLLYAAVPVRPGLCILQRASRRKCPVARHDKCMMPAEIWHVCRRELPSRYETPLSTLAQCDCSRWYRLVWIELDEWSRAVWIPATRWQVWRHKQGAR